jgi:single-strand DNA-binding protein
MSGQLKFPHINSLTISGRLTRDVEVKFSQNNLSISRFSIAVSHYRKDETGEFKEETSFFNAVAFGETAKKCAKELRKGSPVIIEGQIKARSYMDSNNQNRTVTEIMINKVYPMEKMDNADYKNNSSNTTNQSYHQNEQTNMDTTPFDIDNQGIENDVPF